MDLRPRVTDGRQKQGKLALPTVLCHKRQPRASLLMTVNLARTHGHDGNNDADGGGCSEGS